MFNKVITAQYFLWYVTLLPMVLVNNKLTNTKKYIGMALTLGFVVFDANWNRASYRFEFAGEHSFKDIQLANYLWFWYTLIALHQVVVNYKLQITQTISNVKIRHRKPEVASSEQAPVKEGEKGRATGNASP